VGTTSYTTSATAINVAVSGMQFGTTPCHYCSNVLTSLYGPLAAVTGKLHRVQNSEVSLVFRFVSRLSDNPLLAALHWLPIRQRIAYTRAVITFTAIRSGEPVHLRQHVTCRQWSSSTRSSAPPLLTISPCIKTNLAFRTFSYCASGVRNNLLADVIYRQHSG
jgi:hypothetical protein